MKNYIITHAKPIFYGSLTFLSAAGGVVASLLGGWDQGLRVLCIVMALDYISGIICAIIWKKSPKSENGAFESKASIKGLFRKGGMLAFIWLATELDMLSGTDFVRSGAMIFFIGNDGLSIIENLGLMGVPLPKVVKSAFEILKDKGDKEQSAEG